MIEKEIILAVASGGSRRPQYSVLLNTKVDFFYSRLENSIEDYLNNYK